MVVVTRSLVGVMSTALVPPTAVDSVATVVSAATVGEPVGAMEVSSSPPPSAYSSEEELLEVMELPSTVTVIGAADRSAASCTTVASDTPVLKTTAALIDPAVSTTDSTVSAPVEASTSALTAPVMASTVGVLIKLTSPGNVSSSRRRTTAMPGPTVVTVVTTSPGVSAVEVTTPDAQGDRSVMLTIGPVLQVEVGTAESQAHTIECGMYAACDRYCCELRFWAWAMEGAQIPWCHSQRSPYP